MAMLEVLCKDEMEEYIKDVVNVGYQGNPHEKSWSPENDDTSSTRSSSEVTCKTPDIPTILCTQVPNCTYKCDSLRKIKQHVIRCHKGVDVIFCSIAGCGYYGKYRNLKKHVTEAHGDKNICNDDQQIPCSLCKKTFTKQIHLKRHVARVHERRYTEKPRPYLYECNEDGCDRHFSCPAKLLDHMYTHKDDRDYECVRCSKTLKNRSLFAEHLRSYHMISIKQITSMLTIMPSKEKEPKEEDKSTSE